MMNVNLSLGGLRLLSFLGLVIVWQVLAMSLADPLFPTPFAVLSRFWQHLIHGELLYHLGITLGRVALVFIIAMGVGTVLGVIMGHYPQVDALLDNLLVFMLNIPALVIILLCYIWLGLTETAAIVAVVLNKVPNVVVTVREGARAIDKKLMEVAYIFQVPHWRTLQSVYLPQLYPYLLVAARSGLALIWKIVLVVELLGRSQGMGFQLHTYFQFFDIESILAYTLAFVAVMLAVEGFCLRPLERYLSRWRP
ncbi:ABC-type nitrate/sulfonate/bicarbonate transport system, permease component [Beggiatoa alba B18LD]|uniref:ABC-type nitrate/sulfonate/bicarbonate transport system, permease component n=1 Tax=Beggiatoa alba B18LD TaxID=395493 RepID=I3CFB4_9GAMM|nr:ABC transporter permease [Beggiatoa alba]EIJ42307.1 ABC-type nitrate/sulfonate/bicarbonate transport system, permease component [Beggiatoa alba B18LD]